MLINVDDLISEGLNLENMIAVVDNVLFMLGRSKSKEAKYLSQALEELLDDCELRSADRAVL